MENEERHAGRKLAELLAERGMSQKELAKRLGKTPQGLSQLKRSKRFQYWTCRQLAIALDVEASFFLC